VGRGSRVPLPLPYPPPGVRHPRRRCAATLLSALVWWTQLNRHHTAALAFSARYGVPFDNTPAQRAVNPAAFLSPAVRVLWLVWMGMVCGNAVSVKWTGLATPGLVALESFFGLAYLRAPVELLDGMVIAVVAFVTYAYYFWLHFAILTRSGDGDGFMRSEFQRTLVGNPSYDPNASKPPFLVTFFQVRLRLRRVTANSSLRHWEAEPPAHPRHPTPRFHPLAYS